MGVCVYLMAVCFLCFCSLSLPVAPSWSCMAVRHTLCVSVPRASTTLQSGSSPASHTQKTLHQRRRRVQTALTVYSWE